MFLCSEIVWSEWEEENILSWLDVYWVLLWKDHSNAYYKQYQIRRSIKSLQKKKYHILCKQNNTNTELPKHTKNRSQLGVVRRSIDKKASLKTLPKKDPDQNNTTI